MPKHEPGQAPASTLALPFSQIFEQYASYVWRVLRRLGVADCDLQDVSQEVFLVIHQKLTGFEGRATLRSWVFGICVRTAFAHFRKNRRHREIPTHPAPEIAVAASQPGELERRRALFLLDSLLARLGSNERAVYVLYEIEGLTMAEVASALNCHIQTAFSRLYSARRDIEGALKRLRARGMDL